MYGGNDGDVEKWGRGHCRIIYMYLSILRILVRDFSRNFSRGGEVDRKACSRPHKYMYMRP